MNIYVASSWRNQHQPEVVRFLREAGHEVYDFRHPAPGNDGFAWSAIDPKWQAWTPAEFRYALGSVPARTGFKLDMDALRACEACVLVLPCGRSAHLEAGWAAGAGKRVLVYAPSLPEPELMYLMNGPGGGLCLSLDEVRQALQARS